MFVFMIILSIYTITLGTANISVHEVLSAIRKILTNSSLTVQEKIILHLRIPRILMAILAGAGLSFAGTVMQAITRNPLVSPFTIGISSAAAFGASLAIVFGLGIYTSTSFGIVLTAFFFSLLCALLVYGISNKIGLTPETLILTGIALNYLFSAFTATIHFFSQEHQLASAVAWTFGSLNASTWEHVVYVMVVIVICFPLLYRQAWVFNAMASNEDELVQGLGINPAKNRAVAGILSVLVTASIISFTGVIGFVGLVAPHISRLIIGSDHRFLLPFSTAVGGLLVVLADTIGRVILSPVIIPVGIVVSYLGVPLFINLIITRKKGYF
ncbi:MAG: iron ABC transporter permease [Clostridiaceae bacterium]|nr:iron ABC transporter permease [Clostridiaceae bacterium]